MTTGTKVERHRLGPLELLDDSGAQGTIYRVSHVKINDIGPLLYKEYRKSIIALVNRSALERATEFIRRLPRSAAQDLLSFAAWPLEIVYDAGQPVGFLMAEAPQKYYTNLSLPSGKQSVCLAKFTLLLNPESWLLDRGLSISNEVRYQLLLDVVKNLSHFHGHGIRVGDFSPRNALFSLSGKPSCYFIDCDSMPMSGKSAVPQGETPNWRIVDLVPDEKLATTASDLYKFGLLVLRLFAGDPHTTNPSALPAGSVPHYIRWLIVHALGKWRDSRPPLDVWADALAAASRDQKLPPPARVTPLSLFGMAKRHAP